MVFCNIDKILKYLCEFIVTILILIDGFLQLLIMQIKINELQSHNPYFNRWFSAITKRINYNNDIKKVTILILIDGFLQYDLLKTEDFIKGVVTILILIDGFLQ